MNVNIGVREGSSLYDSQEHVRSEYRFPEESPLNNFQKVIYCNMLAT